MLYLLQQRMEVYDNVWWFLTFYHRKFIRPFPQDLFRHSPNWTAVMIVLIRHWAALLTTLTGTTPRHRTIWRVSWRRWRNNSYISTHVFHFCLMSGPAFSGLYFIIYMFIVNGWRKDDVPWMSLALVGEMKGKISAPIIPHGMYFLSTPLPSLLSLLLSEKDMVGWC